MEIYLVRHTTPNIKKGICYGQTDIDINLYKFESELCEIKNKLPSDIDRFYCSPLMRCSKLAKKLAKKIQIDERLIELDFGSWENKKWNELDSHELSKWMENFVSVKAGGAESYLDLHKRTCSFIKEQSINSKQKIAIITHAGNIRSFLSFILGITLENSFRIQLNYSCVIRAEINDKPINNKLYWL